MSTYQWGSDLPVLVYAPDVPLRERLRQDFGWVSRWGLVLSAQQVERFATKRDGRVLAASRLAIRRADVDYAERYDVYHGKRYGNEFERLWVACSRVWEDALPVSGVLDCGDIDALLFRELWLACRLIADAAALQKEHFNTATAKVAIWGQFDSRLADLAMLAHQCRALYAECGADTVALPDSVRQAVERVEILEGDRPARDLGEVANSLREVLQKLDERE